MAKQNATPKSNLFRFVTLRNPQLIEHDIKDIGFVYHPKESSSIFYQAIDGLSDAQKTAALQTASNNFSAYTSRIQVRRAHESLYRFSSWLMRNKNNLSYHSIQPNSGVTPLTQAQEILVWDNLIYQTINKTSVYVREALIQLLIANKFLIAFKRFQGDAPTDNPFTDEEQKEFTRRAHANIVISKALFSKPTLSKREVSSPISKNHLQRMNTIVAELEIQNLERIKEELKTVEVSFNKENAEDFEQKLNEHTIKVQTEIDKATSTVVMIKDELGNTREVKTYPDLRNQEFVYTPKNTLNTTYLSRKLSKEALATYIEKGLDVYEEFLDVYAEVDNQLRTANDLYYSNKKGDSSVVTIGGAKLAAAPKIDRPYCFTAQYKKLPNGEFGVLMVFNIDYANAYIADADVKIRYNQNGTEKESISLQNLSSDNDSFVTFFKFEPLIMATGTAFTFSGEITLNNGFSYAFSSSSIVGIKGGLIFNGFVRSLSDSDSPISKEKPLYGVTNLGIADFRRVEQEVCCYVPGEVSHIENILAREYKERETRNLNSIEVTSETSREREVENLTDTTTTERNEMHSEVAAVLNEDQSQNYGANASVNGSFPGGSFGAGAYFDASSSSSSSNSNSQSQTYAQEVTERAMERIVQKVSTRRTTRILREFEETNRHGFDNTKGDKHVTGIYRWVDKIYKNTLINYGQRLMYEFSIPEPSKFFKEAIYKSIENGTDIPSAIIKPAAPEHPSYYGIEHAGFLNETNYQYVAAKYGAEVNAAPELYEYVGTSLTKSQQGGDGNDDTNKASKESVRVPSGYAAVAAKTSGKSRSGEVQVTVGGLNLGVNSVYFFNIWPYYKDEVPVSGYFVHNWLANINVVIRCERTQELYNQWKNETYSAIMEAYNERLREYNEATIAEELVPEGVDREKISFNPLTNRAIEKREMKRIAIEYLTEQKGLDASKNNYNAVNATTNVAKVRKNGSLDRHASIVKFFEQAFDWEIMAYVFYPYFYADEGDWTALFQEQDAADPIFQAFLQSGMSRVVIPVREGFEDAVNWFMETGELWNGQGLTVDQDDDLYVSIAEEMQATEGIVEDTWETRLPTALTIVQADSAALKEEGLPCGCEQHQDGNPIEPSTDLIGGEEGVTSGSVGSFRVS